MSANLLSNPLSACCFSINKLSFTRKDTEKIGLENRDFRVQKGLIQRLYKNYFKNFKHTKFRFGLTRSGSGLYYRKIPGLRRVRLTLSKNSGYRVRNRRVNPEPFRAESENPGFRNRSVQNSHLLTGLAANSSPNKILQDLIFTLEKVRKIVNKLKISILQSIKRRGFSVKSGHGFLAPYCAINVLLDLSERLS